jgi:RNA polymerase sigma-70 factor (ECF subfamily)
MKIKYTFADETIEIEIAEEWSELIIDLDRQEYNINHKETRRHYSLDACAYEGENFAVEDTAFEELIAGENEEQKINRAISKLKPKQQKLIRAIYFEGIPVSEYAKREGVSQPAISQRLATAIKNLKKLF